MVNNAGVSDWAEIEWSTVDDFRSTVDINLFGCIRTSIAFLPLVRASKGAISQSTVCHHSHCSDLQVQMSRSVFPDCSRSDGFHVEHLCLLPLPEHGSVQCVKERTGGVCRLLEGRNGQFWCKGNTKKAEHCVTSESDYTNTVSLLRRNCSLNLAKNNLFLHLMVLVQLKLIRCNISFIYLVVTTVQSLC